MIDICWERDLELYRDGYKALAVAHAIQDGARYDDEPVNIHFYWRGPRKFGRKQMLPIKAALATQDLSNCKVILWSNASLENNYFVRQLLPYIDHCHYDPVEQAQGTPIDGWDRLQAWDKDCFLDGDLARLLCMYNYGGIYCDMDMVLLRDLAPLLSQEFMYQWGTETIETTSKEKINGAIMRMFKTSKLSCDCLAELTRGNAGLSSTDWGSQLYGRVREYNKNWTIFPGAFFNTEWQVGENMGATAHPMHASSGAVSDYPGAFSWHWHNKWDDEIEAGSKWERIEKRINDAFERKFNEKEYRFDHRNAHLGGNIAGGDSATHEPAVWDAIIQKYGIKTMLDIGCAEGQTVRYFENSDVRAIGFDGIPQNIERASFSCFVHDLTRQPLRRVVDFVWCAEVVEHIDERYMDDLLETLSSGRIIAMTFAEEGKSGFHHVNCQHQQYWIVALDIAGYAFNAEVTENMRALAHGYFKTSGLVFERTGR